MELELFEEGAEGAEEVAGGGVAVAERQAEPVGHRGAAGARVGEHRLEKLPRPCGSWGDLDPAQRRGRPVHPGSWNSGARSPSPTPRAPSLSGQGARRSGRRRRGRRRSGAWGAGAGVVAAGAGAAGAASGRRSRPRGRGMVDPPQPPALPQLMAWPAPGAGGNRPVQAERRGRRRRHARRRRPERRDNPGRSFRPDGRGRRGDGQDRRADGRGRRRRWSSGPPRGCRAALRRDASEGGRHHHQQLRSDLVVHVRSTP